MIRLVTLIMVCGFAFMISCSTPPETENMNHETIIEEDTLLLGAVNREGLQLPNYQYWFDSTYQAYQSNGAILQELRPALNGVDIKVFMATWCEDSQRDIPALYRILDDMDYNSTTLQLIAVDRTKELPKADLEGYDVEFVPTFVFLRDNQEIGRIVEIPTLTLEEDILQIVSQ